MAAPKQVKMGNRGRGPVPQIEHPFRILKRIMGYVMKWYWLQYIFVIVCVFASTFASVQGTMFTRDLIDDYILPMISTPVADYTPLLHAIGRVAVFYAIGIIAAFAQARENKGKPTAIICKTVKGKGVSFMENNPSWHGKAPNEEEYNIAMQDLKEAK